MSRSSRALSIWLMALLLLSFAGCGSGGEQPAADAPFADYDDSNLPSEEEMMKPVAEVNGQPILARQVWGFAELEKLSLIAQGNTIAEEDELRLRQYALMLAIDDELMIQAARADSLEPSPDQIEQRLQEMRAKFGTEDAFRQFLDNAGLSEKEVEEETRRRSLAGVWANNVRAGVKVDEKKAREFYDERKWDLFKEPEQVRIAFILTAAGPTDPEEQHELAKKKIEAAQKLLEAGEPFPRVARNLSEDAKTAPNGGDLGFHARGGSLLKEFEELAFNMDVGEVSPVFETLHGYNLMTVVSKREERVLDFDDVKSNLFVAVMQYEQGRKLEQAIAKLHDEATIEIFDDSLRIKTADAAQPAGNS